MNRSSNRFSKKDRLREKTRVDIEQSGQTTFDNLPAAPKKGTSQLPAQVLKEIEIVEVNTETREDELRFKVVFRLLPSRTHFSKLTAELHFDGQSFHAVPLSILEGSLPGNDFEFGRVLDMTGIVAGPHVIRVDLFEKWVSGEKLTTASNELQFDYVPVKKEDRLIRIPSVKSVPGDGLAVISGAEKAVYEEMDETLKKEQMSERDSW